MPLFRRMISGMCRFPRNDLEISPVLAGHLP